MTRTPELRSKNANFGSAEILYLVVTALFATVFCFSYGNQQFGGYDLGMLVDVAWRQHIGQRPYQDFICTLPPGFYLPGKFAFNIFGATWNALIYLNVIFIVAFSTWALWLLRILRYPLGMAGLMTFACLSSLLLTTHWWHSNTTSCIAVLFLLSAILVEERANYAACISLTLSLGLLLLSKPNLAVPLAACLTMIMLIAGRQKRSVVLCVMGAVLLAFAICWANGIAVGQWMASYSQVAGRAWPDKFIPDGLELPDKLVFLLSIIVCLTPLSAITLSHYGKKNVTSWLIPATGVLCGLYAMGTNWDINLNDAPLVLLSSTLLVLGPSRCQQFNSNRVKNNWAVGCLIAICLWSLYLGTTRYRNRLVGYGTYFEWPLVSQPAPSPFFGNLKSGAHFHRTLAEIQTVLSSQPVLDREAKPNIFFGPRLEWAYAAFGIPSPERLPIWWHSGSSYGMAQEQMIAHAWRDHKFSILIFHNNRLSHMPLAVRREISAHYRMDKRVSDVAVFYRNQS